MPSPAEMIDTGQRKMTEKSAKMARNYDAKKSDMIKHYREVGFKNIRNENYEDSVNKASHRTDSSKWARNWKDAMFD